jgi:peptidoglycan hydrolase-like protein with peptidoglycan-binding domain
LRGIVDAVGRAHARWALLLVLSALIVAAPPASADTVRASASAEVVVKRGDRGSAVRRVQSRLGIPADGVFGPQTERAVKRFQRAKGLVVDGVVGPQTRAALGLGTFSPSSVRRSSGGSIRSILRAIAECESGGNPRAVSPGGLYRGKYQFRRATWERLGGKGDPADAPEWLQDRIARKLYRQSGNAPWPNCP